MKSYSIDLRSRVTDHIKNGYTQSSAAKIFKVSSSAVNRWWIRYQEEGTIESKANPGSKGKVDPESLKNFVEANSDKTLREIGEHFGVRASSIYCRLKKLGFSYKKKPSPMWKPALRNERNT